MYKVVWTICPKLGLLCHFLVHLGLKGVCELKTIT